MGNAPSRPDDDIPDELDCEQCGISFPGPARARLSVPCPGCGAPISAARLSEPMWWAAVAGMALSAIAIPGLAYRMFGPGIALPVAGFTLLVVWFTGRRF